MARRKGRVWVPISGTRGPRRGFLQKKPLLRSPAASRASARSQKYSIRDDPPARKREHERGRLALDTAGPAPSVLAIVGHDRVARLLRSFPPMCRLPRSEEASHAAPDAIMAVVDTRLRDRGLATSDSTSGSKRPNHASSSLGSRPRRARRTISTFSCDIAYSESPAASRASSRSEIARDADDLAVAERPDVTDGAQPRAARAGRAARTGRARRLVAASRNSVELDVDALPRLSASSPKNSLNASWPRTRPASSAPRRRSSPLDLGVEGSTRIDVAGG